MNYQIWYAIFGLILLAGTVGFCIFARHDVPPVSSPTSESPSDVEAMT